MRRTAHNRRRRRLLPTAVAAAVALAAVPAMPAAGDANRRAERTPVFEHLATFDVTSNGTEMAEIVTSTVDGKTLLYTDSDTGNIGIVDARDPARPRPDGTIHVGGEPTSVAVAGRYALVAVNTSPTFTDPSGHLAVVDVKRRQIVRTINLGGQPDSVALALNTRPRKTLGWRTPAEALNELLLSA